MTKLRVSQHSGRRGSAKHNDRSFLVGLSDEERREVAPHIHPEAMQENREWRWTGREDKRPLEEVELDFYRTRYAAALERTNERYRREGHAERCRTPEQLYRGAKSRPEEMILQIGDREANISPEAFKACVADYMHRLGAWSQEHGGHMHLLTAALHFDETSPHAHIRRVWDYTDRDGLTRLGQNKALEAAGVPLPDPTKPEGRYNNRKIAFDLWARGMWQDVCKAHGFEVETEPIPGKRHQEKADWMYQQNAERLERQERQLEQGERELTMLEFEQDKAAEQLDATNAEISRQAALEAQARENTAQAVKIEQRAKERAARAIEEAQDKERQLEQLEGRILTAQEVRQMDEPAKTIGGFYKVPPQEYKNLVATAALVDEAQKVLAREDEIISHADRVAREALQSSGIEIRHFQEQAEKHVKAQLEIINSSRTPSPLREHIRQQGRDNRGGR